MDRNKSIEHSRSTVGQGLTAVLLNDFVYVQGGGSKVAIAEAVALAEAGVRVIFVGAVGPAGPELQAADIEVVCTDQRELISVGKHPTVMFQAMWNTVAYRRMKQVLAALDPATTIVHLHGWTKALSTSPLRAAHELGFRVICTLHDFFSACPNGAFYDFQQKAPCLRTALSPACLTANCDKRQRTHKVFRVARSTTERVVGRFPSAVENYIYLSEQSKRILTPYLPRSARFFKMKNVIDVPLDAPVDVSKNTAVTFVGRLDEEKGVLLVRRLAGMPGLELVFAGEGPMRPALENVPGVTVTGWLTPAGVVERLNQARCLVFPSLWYETYGLVVEEAAARGVPAIVSDVSAAAERVIDGVTGWIFRSGDLTSFGNAVTRALEPGAAEQAGRRAYDRYWAKPPTAANHAVALTDIYRTVLGSETSARAAAA